jgi:hypothetical protein
MSLQNSIQRVLSIKNIKLQIFQMNSVHNEIHSSHSSQAVTFKRLNWDELRTKKSKLRPAIYNSETKVLLFASKEISLDEISPELS